MVVDIKSEVSQTALGSLGWQICAEAFAFHPIITTSTTCILTNTSTCGLYSPLVERVCYIYCICFLFFFLPVWCDKKISPVSSRSSPATGSVTRSTQPPMTARPSSPPREEWAMAWSSCWTSSRMNTCQCGERPVRAAPPYRQTWHVLKTLRQSPWPCLTPCRRDVVWSWDQSSDSQPRRAFLHRPVWVWSGAWISDVCLLSGTKGADMSPQSNVQILDKFKRKSSNFFSWCLETGTTMV